MSEGALDLGDCPYFNGTGTRLCSYGCYDEPHCHTSEPTGGWPSRPWPREITEDVTTGDNDG